ncbi:MAG: hypothetical protein V1659_05450, partial [Candidatus Woesearchaeota archaeon]
GEFSLRETAFDSYKANRTAGSTTRASAPVSHQSQRVGTAVQGMFAGLGSTLASFKSVGHRFRRKKSEQGRTDPPHEIEPEEDNNGPGFFRRLADYLVDTNRYAQARLFHGESKDYDRPSLMDVLTNDKWRNLHVVRAVDNWFYDHRRGLDGVVFGLVVAAIPAMLVMSAKPPKISDTASSTLAEYTSAEQAIQEAQPAMISFIPQARALNLPQVAQPPLTPSTILTSDLGLLVDTAITETEGSSITHVVAYTTTPNNNERLVFEKYYPKTGDNVSSIALRTKNAYHLSTPIYGEGGLVSMIKAENNLPENAMIFADETHQREPLRIPIPYDKALDTASKAYMNGTTLVRSVSPFKNLDRKDVKEHAYRLAAQEGRQLRFDQTQLPEELRQYDKIWAEQKASGMDSASIANNFSQIMRDVYGIGMGASISKVNRTISKHR